MHTLSTMENSRASTTTPSEPPILLKKLSLVEKILGIDTREMERPPARLGFYKKDKTLAPTKGFTASTAASRAHQSSHKASRSSIPPSKAVFRVSAATNLPGLQSKASVRPKASKVPTKPAISMNKNPFKVPFRVDEPRRKSAVSVLPAAPATKATLVKKPPKLSEASLKSKIPVPHLFTPSPVAIAVSKKKPVAPCASKQSAKAGTKKPRASNFKTASLLQKRSVRLSEITTSSCSGSANSSVGSNDSSLSSEDSMEPNTPVTPTPIFVAVHIKEKIEKVPEENIEVVSGESSEEMAVEVKDVVKELKKGLSAASPLEGVMSELGQKLESLKSRSMPLEAKDKNRIPAFASVKPRSLKANKENGDAKSTPKVPLQNIQLRTPLQDVSNLETPSAGYQTSIEQTIFGARKVRRVVIPPLPEESTPSQDPKIQMEISYLRSQKKVRGGRVDVASGGKHAELSLFGQAVLEKHRRCM